MSNSFDDEPNIIPTTKEEYIKNGNRFLSLDEFFGKCTNKGTNKTTARKTNKIISIDQEI